MKQYLNILYKADQDPACKLDLYLPDCDSFPVFLYLHGGGLEAGDKDDILPACSYLTQRGVAVISANYRMYPDAVYPQFLEDSAAAVAWALAHIGAYGNCTGLFVGGSSAGGYLSMMLCFDPSYLLAQGVQPEQIAGYVLDAGQPTTHFNVLRERGLDPRRVLVDEAAPLFHVGLHPLTSRMLFLVSDQDMFARYEQTQLLMTTLRHFEVDSSLYRLELLHSQHCQCVWDMHASGENVFAKLIYGFIRETQALQD